MTEIKFNRICIARILLEQRFVADTNVRSCYPASQDYVLSLEFSKKIDAIKRFNLLMYTFLNELMIETVYLK